MGRGGREAAIERHWLRAAAAALLALAPAARPAHGQPGAKPRAAQERPAQERAAPDKPAPDRSPPVVGCPSLANYRMLMREGAASAAATLADPKADHLGCAALPRARITGATDRIVLGGRSYTCAGVQGTTACHWMEAGTPPEPVTGAVAGQGR